MTKRKNLIFVATRIKRQPIKVSFYTKAGERVNIPAIKITASKTKPRKIKFYTKKS